MVTWPSAMSTALFSLRTSSTVVPCIGALPCLLGIQLLYSRGLLRASCTASLPARLPFLLGFHAPKAIGSFGCASNLLGIWRCGRGGLRRRRLILFGCYVYEVRQMILKHPQFQLRFLRIESKRFDLF